MAGGGALHACTHAAGTAVRQSLATTAATTSCGASSKHQPRLPTLTTTLCRCPHPTSAGWAIEGAIGSEHKIDASYLSPHVNMAARLEAATKQFGATILLSDDFVRMLSPGVRWVREKIVAGRQCRSTAEEGKHTTEAGVP